MVDRTGLREQPRATSKGFYAPPFARIASTIVLDAEGPLLLGWSGLPRAYRSRMLLRLNSWSL